MRSPTPTSSPDAVEPRLLVLGPPTLAVTEPGGTWTDAIGPSKSLALLTYLALSPRRSASRDRLCDLLWSDREIEEGRTQLRQTLWLCRRKAPQVEFATAGDNVTLTTPLDVDALAFTAALQSNELERAVGLYRGDFFDGYAAPGAKQFQDWADLERARYRAMAAGVVETLGRRALAAGRTPASIREARRLREIDPHSESSWRLLLESLAASGDLHAARATAAEFEAWLRMEEREPEASSLAALRIAKREGEKPRADASATLRGEMVGRETPFATLHRAWTGARGRPVTHIHLVSETGVGKTRLITEFAEYLRAHPARALLARANPGDREIAFGFCARLAAAFSQRAGAVGVAPESAAILLALNPAVSSVFNTAASARALDPRNVGLALTDLVAAVADDAPFALLLDDLHWVDDASLAALTLLTTHLEHERFLLVSTARPHYALGGFANAAERITLAPLCADEVEALISSLGSLPDAAWARELPAIVHERSGGNPLIVHDLLRVAVDSGILTRRDGGWECPDPSRLSLVMARTSAMQQRISGLGDLERRLLLPLALAGVPIPLDLLARAVGRNASEIGSDLMALEQRGFARRTSDDWMIAHDAILEALTATASPAERISTHAALGSAFAATHSLDDDRRALHHLIAATAWDPAASLATSLLLSDRRAVIDEGAVRAFVGPDAPVAIVKRIIRAMPMHRRLSIVQRSLVAATLLLIVAGAAWARSTPPLPALTLALAHPDASGRWRGAEVELDRTSWDPSVPLIVGSDQRSWHAVGDLASDHHSPRPGSEQWAVSSVSADSGEGDIYLFGPSGERERLTFAPGQDIPGSFSPDGSRLVLSTTRWSARGYASLAVLELGTGQIRRLTSSEGTDQSSHWSPDGTRIAFSRYTHATDRSELCVIDADGAYERCSAALTERLAGVLGWRDPSTLLVVTDSSGILSLLTWEVLSGEAKLAGPLRSNSWLVDPSGRWILARDEGPDGSPRLSVAPTDAPTLIRQIVTPGWSNRVRASFIARSPIGAQIDSLVVSGAGRVVTSGIPHLLSVRGITRDGRAVEVPHVRWSAQGGSAVIDTLGALVAKGAGEIEVTASAGGWRAARITTRAALPPTPVVTIEDWAGDPWARWRRFGEPEPRIDSSARGEKAFLNSGDGSFLSGAYTRTTAPAGRGLALDVDVSTPITSTQWQVLGVALVNSDSSALATWDHRSGYPAFGGDWGCVQLYPGGERPRDRRTLGPVGDLASVLGEDAARIYDGRSWRLRLQVFPDGRCGIAINGVALLIKAPSGTAFSDSTHAHAVLMGSSVGTRIAVRRATLTVGVPPGVDWDRLVPQGKNWVRRPRRE